MKHNPPPAASYPRQIATAVEAFDAEEDQSKDWLAGLLALDAATFSAASIRLIANAKSSPGVKYLVDLLSKQNLLTTALLDGAVCGREEAIAAAELAANAGTPLRPALEIALRGALREPASERNSRRILRILNVLSAVAEQNTWNRFETDLMQYPDRHVRSKAALLIGCSTKNVPWIGRQLLDEDARVRANAVEALWTVRSDDARVLLQAAARSQDNRIAGNAAVGLYHLSDTRSIRLLMDLAMHEHPTIRSTGIWAIGETQDPRFVPFLVEQFRTADGELRLSSARALARIRRREKANWQVPPVQIRMLSAEVLEDRSRRLVVALRGGSMDDLTAIRSTEFAIWENDLLAIDYEVAPANPAAVAIGILAPESVFQNAPCGQSLIDTLSKCIETKRTRDLWRIDSFRIQPDSPALCGERGDYSAGPRGFSEDPRLLQQTMPLVSPYRTAVFDLPATLESQCRAIGECAAERHIVVCIPDDVADPAPRVAAFVRSHSIVLHGIAPESANVDALRELCGASSGTFTAAGPTQWPEVLYRLHAGLWNRFEIMYRTGTGSRFGPVTLSVSSAYGSGRTAFLQPSKPRSSETI